MVLDFGARVAISFLLDNISIPSRRVYREEKYISIEGKIDVAIIKS